MIYLTIAVGQFRLQ